MEIDLEQLDSLGADGRLDDGPASAGVAPKEEVKEEEDGSADEWFQDTFGDPAYRPQGSASGDGSSFCATSDGKQEIWVKSIAYTRVPPPSPLLATIPQGIASPGDETLMFV